MLLANTCVSVLLTFILHGLKNASPNGSRNVNSQIPGLIVILSLLPTFLVVLGVILMTNVGAYIIVTFQHTGVFYAVYFYIWLFVMLALPVLYFVTLELKYQFLLHYQAYYFTQLSLNIVRDYELLTYDETVIFLQTKKQLLAHAAVTDRKSLECIGKTNIMSVSERNNCLYEPIFSEIIYIPKDTNRLQISWYSAVEDAYYENEIDFPFDKLEYVENKYPLDVSKFLRGKKAERVTLLIQQGGKVELFNKHQNLLEAIIVKSVDVSAENKKQWMEALDSACRVKELPRLINTIMQSKSIEKRLELLDYVCSWQVSVTGEDRHNVEIKDVRHNYTTSAPIALDSFEQRRLPIFFEIDYRKTTWLYIHIDAEKLYSVIQRSGDLEPILTFDFTLDLENGKVNLLLKNKGAILPFTAWEKQVNEYRWEEVKDMLLENKDFTIKNNILKEIYELILKKNYSGAQQLCKKALEQYPYFPMIYFYEARLLWYTQGFEVSFSKEPYFIEKTKTDPYALAQIYNNYGCLYDEEKRYVEALERFEKAYATYPQQLFYLANIAEIYYKLKDAKQAFHYAKECIEKEFTSDIVDEIVRNKGVIMNKEPDNSIEGLQIKLSELAAKYRSSEEDSELHHQVLKEYYSTFQQLVALNGGIIGLDPDAELPERLMPKEYVEYWHNGGSSK